jgi:BioD-like phosphotransacetylase family protein
MAPIVIYITGFRQHAGKTVTSLGIISRLRKIIDPSLIAYIKPVGHELVELPDGSLVDKDAEILRKFSGIPDLDPRMVSPVKLGSGFTQEYLRSPDHLRETRKLQDSILACLDRLSRKEVVIAEGTGHPGVGGIVGLSNADVANLMKASMIFLSGGGLGKALDMLEVDLSYFLYKKSRLRGLIFNKVFPDKMDGMKKLVTEDLLNNKYGAFGGPMRILGFLPEIGDLSKPSMRTIAEKYGDAEPLDNMTGELWEIPCGQTRIISMDAHAFKPEDYVRPLDVVIIAASSKRRTRMILEAYCGAKARIPIAGLVLTCGRTDSLDSEVRKEISAVGVPTLIVKDDTASTEQKILEIFDTTKLQSYDVRKITEIEDLFAQHFPMDVFLETFLPGK